MLSFFPLDVLDEIWDLIESVSEGFLTCSDSNRKVLRKTGEDIDERFSCWIPLLRTSPVKCALKNPLNLENSKSCVYLLRNTGCCALCS